MVQLDAVVTQVLPDPEADISTCGRQKRVFKFISIRVPCFEGFQELEGYGRVRPSRREIIIVISCVNHMPQTHDATLLSPFVIRVRADERNSRCTGGSNFVRNGATSPCTRSSKQESQPSYKSKAG